MEKENQGLPQNDGKMRYSGSKRKFTQELTDRNRKIRRLYMTGISTKQLSERFGLTINCIHAILNFKGKY